MSQKELAFKIEELFTEAEKTNSLQASLFEAIYNGNNAHTSYEWAFVLLGEMTFNLRNELENLVNIAFEDLRKDGVTIES